MSDAPESFAAYTPPVEAGFAETPNTQLATGIKAICIIAIILGAMGTMSAITGAVALAIGPKLQEMFAPPQLPSDNEGAERFRKIQDEMQRNSKELMQRYMPAFLVRIIFHLAISVALLAGGVATLTGSARGRSILRTTCAVAIPFVICRAVLDTIVQLENAAIMRPFMEMMTDGGIGGEGPPAEMMSSIFKAVTYAGLVFGLVMVLAKVVFYLISFIKLRRSETGTALQTS